MVSTKVQAAQRMASRRSDAGYNLVILLMIITVMNIMLAVAMPVWSHAARREKEEQLIFRGLQYAEAIRVFQRRHGRAPTRLEELIEVEPRSIRQLWPEPMSEHGAWGLLVQRGAAAAPAQQQQGGRNPGAQARNRRDQRNRPQRAQRDRPGGNPEPGANQGRPQPNQARGGGQSVVPIPPKAQSDGTTRAIATGGQIVGVYSPIGEESIKTFLGAESYDQWHFTVELIPAPVVPPGDAPLPRANSAWIGRPFRDGLQPKVPGRGRPGAGKNLTPQAQAPTRDKPGRRRRR